MLRFFKQFLIYGFASILAKIAAIFLMPFYTNILTKEEYGAMAMITACKGVIDLFSNLNIHSGIARDYYEENINRKKLVSTGFYSILGCALTIFIILFITRNFWTSSVLHLNGYNNAFFVMLLTIPAGGLFSYFAILTRLKKKPILYAVGNIIQLLIQISLSIYLVLFIHTGIVGIFIGVLAGELFGIIYYALLNKEILAFTFDKNLLKRALIFSIPTLPAILAGWIDNSLGQVLIGKYVSLEELGVYSVALQFSSIFLLISTALNNVWYPYLFENYQKQHFKSEIEKLYKLMIVALIFITLNLSLLSKDIVLLLSNSGYINASQYITLLCFSMGVYLLLPFVSAGVNINRTTKYLSYSYISGSIANLVLLFFLLPKIGVIAAPICLAVSRIINYLILYKYSKGNLNINYPNYLLLVFLGITILCFLINKIDCYRFWVWIMVFIADSIFFVFIEKKYSVILNIKNRFKA